MIRYSRKGVGNMIIRAPTPMNKILCSEHRPAAIIAPKVAVKLPRLHQDGMHISLWSSDTPHRL